MVRNRKKTAAENDQARVEHVDHVGKSEAELGARIRHDLDDLRITLGGGLRHFLDAFHLDAGFPRALK